MPQDGGALELIDALRYRWKLVLVIAGFTFLGAAAYAESLPSKYTATAISSFAPEEGVGTDAVRVLLPSYVSYVTAPATIARVAPTIGESRGALETGLDASVTTDTGTLIIKATMLTPQRAAAAANAFSEAAVERSDSPVDTQLDGGIVAQALEPGAPSGPPRRLLEAAALTMGLIAGAALAFLLERGRPRVRTWRDLSRITGYSVLGRVPASRTLRARPTQAFTDPIIGSAFRTLRTNLEFELRDRTIGLIVVTSATPGDGKTTVAALLAESLARLGAHVLLVDADLRRPGVSRTYRLDAEKGLSTVLRGSTTLNESIKRGWVEGLSVLPTRPDPDAGDLLARRFQDVVREARETFDLVVADSPPLLGTDDARTLATMASGVLLVIPAGAVAGPVNEAVLALEGLKTKVLGVVGNRLRESKDTYYYSAST